MSDPYPLATWRFEQIAFLMDETLPKALREHRLKEVTREGVPWPSGEVKPIGRSTLYRWLTAYRKHGLKGLLPGPRKDKGKSREDRSEPVADAIALLLERPERSLTQLLEYVKLRFPQTTFSRSTLARELKKHPAHASVLKTRRGGGLKRRFEAGEAHEIWQLDAKGPFQVRFKDGRQVRVVVLSALDDCTRYVVAAALSRSESLAGAVKVFRAAAMRWGLPARIYCDRHSVYDSGAFRQGLAELGVHRINTKPGRKEARGKIERYHRVLDGWFVKELRHQEVIDEIHLEELLQATLDLLYHRHRHRTLRGSPAEALGEKRSKREVSPEDLQRAFSRRESRKTHPKTGEVTLEGCAYQVPVAYAGQRCRFAFDPVETGHAVLLTDEGQSLILQPILKHHPPPEPREPRRGAGALQQVLDEWRGRKLPLAPAGFGLPEVFESFTRHLGRKVPATERDAEALQHFYRHAGPFQPEAFEDAMERLVKQLGPDRPLDTSHSCLSHSPNFTHNWTVRPSIRSSEDSSFASKSTDSPATKSSPTSDTTSTKNKSEASAPKSSISSSREPADSPHSYSNSHTSP